MAPDRSVVSRERSSTAVARALTTETALTPATRVLLAPIIERLVGPFVIAIAGRVKAGKSTLVNALLGRELAASSVAECTALVTRFAAGDTDRAWAVTRSGDRIAIPMGPTGRLPEHLPVQAGDVDHLEVELVSDVLRDLVLVDTPGLSTVREENAERTADFLGLDLDSQAACSSADAVVFLVNQAVRADDADALRRFLSACGSRNLVATVGVLSKADHVEGGSEVADRLAVRHSETLRGLATQVVPLVGLVAAALRCGLFTATQAEDLAALASMPVDELSVLLLDVDLFVAGEAPVSAPSRQVLVEMLGMPAIAVAIELLRTGAIDVAGLPAQLEAFSRIRSLDAAVELLRRRSDALKADAALAAVERLAWRPELRGADGDTLKAVVAELRASPALHSLKELQVLDLALRGGIDLTSQELREIDLLCSTAPASQRLGMLPSTETRVLASEAYARAVRWHAESNREFDPQRRNAARVVQRSYKLLWDELGGTTDG